MLKNALNHFYFTLKAEKAWTLFLFGFFIKLCFSFLFASPYLTELFIPFVNYFYESSFQNPYQYFIETGVPHAFPYPTFMLFLLTIPKGFLGWLSSGSSNEMWDIFIYRLPVLFADFSTFFILSQWLKGSIKRLTWFYWLSPVLIYINYLHGQLDVIPIALLFIGLYFLFKDRSLLCSLFVGLAISSKAHTAISLPFFIIYLHSQKQSFKEDLLFVLTIIGTFLVTNLPFIFDQSFTTMVFHNKQQGKVFLAQLQFFDGLSLYLIPASLLLLLLKSFLIKFYNRKTFLMFLGFSFGIILLFVPPAHGWYYWIIPFLSYFYCRENGRSFLLFVFLQISYLVYFLLIPQSDSFEIFQVISPDFAKTPNVYTWLEANSFSPQKILNLAFTALQTLLFTNCVWLYNKGLSGQTGENALSQPFLIGIGGNSGSGKTTLSRALSQIFGIESTSLIQGDDMHRWERHDAQWSQHTHLDPKANDLHQEIHFFKRLKRGKKILRRHYNHDNGKFESARPITVKKIIIFEGLHPFYLAPLRKMYDLKIFLKPAPQLHTYWKMKRDTKQRNKTPEDVLRQLEEREADALKHIAPQEQHADIVIEFLPGIDLENMPLSGQEIDLRYKLSFPNFISFKPLLDRLNKEPSLDIKHNYDINDRQSFTFQGQVDYLDIEKVVQEVIPDLDDICAFNPHFPRDLYGITLLFIIYSIFEKNYYEH